MKTSLLQIGTFLLLSNVALAKDTYVLKGTGIDGKACSVKIVSERDELLSVELTGATEQFEILAETRDGYRPKTSITSNGASEIISFLQDSPSLYKEMEISRGIFRDSITYKLDTSDLPGTREETGGIKAKIQIKLDFKYNKLSKAYVNFKGKAMFVTLASSTFECK